MLSGADGMTPKSHDEGLSSRPSPLFSLTYKSSSPVREGTQIMAALTKLPLLLVEACCVRTSIKPPNPPPPREERSRFLEDMNMKNTDVFTSGTISPTYFRVRHHDRRAARASHSRVAHRLLHHPRRGDRDPCLARSTCPAPVRAEHAPRHTHGARVPGVLHRSVLHVPRSCHPCPLVPPPGPLLHLRARRQAGTQAGHRRAVPDRATPRVHGFMLFLCWHLYELARARVMVGRQWAVGNRCGANVWRRVHRIFRLRMLDTDIASTKGRHGDAGRIWARMGSMGEAYTIQIGTVRVLIAKRYYMSGTACNTLVGPISRVEECVIQLHMHPT